MWGKTLSRPKIKSAPSANPIAAGITLVNPSPSDISIPGAKRLQKLAATITHPVKPSIPSKNPLCMVLKRKTNEAPKAVNNHVKIVAIKAPSTGLIPEKNLSIVSNLKKI